VILIVNEFYMHFSTSLELKTQKVDSIGKTLSQNPRMDLRTAFAYLSSLIYFYSHYIQFSIFHLPNLTSSEFSIHEWTRRRGSLLPNTDTHVSFALLFSISYFSSSEFSIPHYETIL
jgi:hypothetical protein